MSRGVSKPDDKHVPVVHGNSPHHSPYPDTQGTVRLGSEDERVDALSGASSGHYRSLGPTGSSYLRQLSSSLLFCSVLMLPGPILKYFLVVICLNIYLE